MMIFAKNDFLQDIFPKNTEKTQNDTFSFIILCTILHHSLSKTQKTYNFTVLSNTIYTILHQMTPSGVKHKAIITSHQCVSLDTHGVGVIINVAKMRSSKNGN